MFLSHADAPFFHRGIRISVFSANDRYRRISAHHPYPAPLSEHSGIRDAAAHGFPVKLRFPFPIIFENSEKSNILLYRYPAKTKKEFCQWNSLRHVRSGKSGTAVRFSGKHSIFRLRRPNAFSRCTVSESPSSTGELESRSVRRNGFSSGSREAGEFLQLRTKDFR